MAPNKLLALAAALASLNIDFAAAAPASSVISDPLSSHAASAISKPLSSPAQYGVTSPLSTPYSTTLNKPASSRVASSALSSPLGAAPSGLSACPSGECRIKTSSGTIQGHRSPQYPSVNEYLGIPFAAAPLGDLRFAAPKPFKPNATASSSVLVADKQALVCRQAPQAVNTSLPQNWQNIDRSDGYKDVTSEDCLYLNVWTPSSCSGSSSSSSSSSSYAANGAKNDSSASASASALKPVMLWWVGGGFHTGGIADPKQQGAIWAAEHDMIFVSSNYRLGIFGFPGAASGKDGDMGGSVNANPGILDQRMAVQWVRDNIRAFGGDPDHIVITGHSAGGSSVDLYNYAWAEDPLVVASIPMSSTATTLGSLSPQTATYAWDTAARLAGCGNSNTTSAATILKCMRQKSTDEVFNAWQQATPIVTQTLSNVGKIYAGIKGVFSPTVDNKTIFADYAARGKAGKFIKTPVLVGDNSDEGCFFSMTNGLPIKADPIITEAVFECPSTWRGIYSHVYNGLPAWRYRYVGAWPNTYAPDCPGKPWHSQEVYVLFNTTEFATKQPATKREIETGAYMRRAWASFIRDPANGLSREFGWPMVGSNGTTISRIGMNETDVKFVNSTKKAEPCFTVFANGAPEI